MIRSLTAMTGWLGIGDVPCSNAKRRLSGVDHGPNGEDDCCNAAAGAMALAIGRQPLIVFDAALAKLRLPSRAHPMFWQRAFF
jgi:hypothetical protein